MSDLVGSIYMGLRPFEELLQILRPSNGRVVVQPVLYVDDDPSMLPPYRAQGLVLLRGLGLCGTADWALICTDTESLEVLDATVEGAALEDCIRDSLIPVLDEHLIGVSSRRRVLRLEADCPPLQSVRPPVGGPAEDGGW